MKASLQYRLPISDADQARDAERAALRKLRSNAQETIAAMRELSKRTKAYGILRERLQEFREAMADKIEKIQTCNERIIELDMEGEF